MLRDTRVIHLYFDNLFACLSLPDDAEANLKYKSII